MLRCSRVFVVRLLVAVSGTFVASAGGVAAEPVAAPRALMRLPDWIESLGGERLAAAPAKTTDSRAVLTGGWNELVDETKPTKQSDAAGTAAGVDAPMEEPSAKPPLGPESSVLDATTPPRESTAAPTAASPPVPSDKPAPAVEPSPAPAASAPTKGHEATTQTSTRTAAAPAPTASADSPTLSIDPASFRGAFPGKTTREEIEVAWGPGEEFAREDGVKGIFWVVEPFERVEVTIVEGVVDSIRIKLVEPVALHTLAEQMEINDLRTVSVLDEKGISIGEVFPERGVVVSLKPGTHSATAVIIEPLDAESFVLRAEGEIDESTAHAVTDLQYAIEVDPQHVRAHKLLLALLCEQGCWQRALKLAEAAKELDPDDIWTRLKHAGVLLALGRTDEARVAVESVRSLEKTPPLVSAQTAKMLGSIELAARTPDYQKSVTHFEEAIRKATPLMTNPSKSIQKAGRVVLLEAHLGTATAIARGTWQQKGRVIPKWITRSETLVGEVDAADPDRNLLELQLCRGALAASAGAVEGVEALPWVKRLLETREKLGTQVKDASRRRQIDWEVGLGLADALTASLKRNDPADMLENATLTAAYLERGAEQRELSDRERREYGDLLFRIGILHSLQHGAHATAVTWFDKVVPLWENNSCFTNEGDTGRLGEALVSMAISYWQVERRADAMSLSRKGVDLMVEAVDSKQLDERALAVAYGNLSTMYAEQGDQERSRNYAEMASRAEASTIK